MQRRAFTLIELLVVIAIIGLLSTIAIVSVDSSRVKARNAKRLADTKQMVTAFETGYSVNGAFPSTGGNVWVCVSASCYDNWSIYTANGTVDAWLGTYLPTKPVDPVGGNRGYGGYAYNGAWPANGNLPSFVYMLEKPSSSCGVGFIFDNSSPNYVYCRYNFQL
jgi:prepilin-type N-terminal cleavage/methylation domain-containing protein